PILLNGCIECAAIPAQRPLTSLVLNILLVDLIDRIPFNPNPVRSNGNFGSLMGSSISIFNLSQFSKNGRIKLLYFTPSLPILLMVTSNALSIITHLPYIKGWTTYNLGNTSYIPSNWGKYSSKKGEVWIKVNILEQRS